MGLAHGVTTKWQATKGIVQDGLVLSVDAAVKESYSNGTSWKDLTGNNTGTLTNMSAANNFSREKGGIFSFDGTDERIDFANSLTLTAATFVSWIKRSGTQSGWNGILMSRGNGGGTSGMFFGYQNNRLSYMWNGANYNWSSSLIVPDQEWCMVAVSVSSSSVVAYLHKSDGVTTGSSSFTHSSSNLNKIEIGRDPQYTGQRHYNGHVAASQIYNRALTSSELLQNFNVTRHRFGV